MTENDLQPLLRATEALAKTKAKQELLDRIVDLHRTLDIATEVIVWLNETDQAESKTD